MRKVVQSLLATLFVAVCTMGAPAGRIDAPPGGELRVSVRVEPRTLHPLLVEDESSDLVRYLTHGMLMRINRATNRVEPDLATSWKISKDGREIRFELRSGVRFSDGTVFDANDVAFTIKTLFDPNLHSPVADAFRVTSSTPQVDVLGPLTARIAFAAPIAGMDRLFDQVAILSARSPLKERAGLGPFSLVSQLPGKYAVLQRNPNYWKRDASGKPLPYLDSIRLLVQPNADLEALAFERGETDVVFKLDPAIFERLQAKTPGAVLDLGATYDSEFVWFNQTGRGNLPAYKREWFASKAFRNAISMAINRDDLCRIVYRGHGKAAVGPFPPENTLWFNRQLAPHKNDVAGAVKLLQSAGFQKKGEVLYDAKGNAVTFSLLTNAGSRTRERISTLLERDLQAIGIKLQLVALDFPSLIGRMTKSFDYDAVLLGLVGVDEDPNGQMNIWLSSSGDHQWNPSQSKPATEWEARMDRAMQAQAAEPDYKKRKAAYDQLQQIVRDQEPFLYLSHPNALIGVSPRVKNTRPVVARPQVLWNAEYLRVEPRT